MRWRYCPLGWITACSAAFGIGAIAGLLPGARTEPGFLPSPSPAEIVAARFDSIPVKSPQPVAYRLASAVAGGPQAFDAINVDPVGEPSPPQAEAAAPPSDALKAVAEAGRKSGSAGADAARRALPHPPAASTLLNNAQIASIHERLKLSSYQNQLWPPVESALRGISWRKDAKGKIAASDPRNPAIDPDSAQVQRLKSAAVPLIMSFNEDQKQEVRTMLRLMGLENLATRF